MLKSQVVLAGPAQISWTGCHLHASALSEDSILLTSDLFLLVSKNVLHILRSLFKTTRVLAPPLAVMVTESILSNAPHPTPLPHWETALTLMQYF